MQLVDPVAAREEIVSCSNISDQGSSALNRGLLYIVNPILSCTDWVNPTSANGC